MKNNKMIAVTSGVIALAALVLSVRTPVNVESFVGYASVIALVGVAALEYRISWKRVFGRK